MVKSFDVLYDDFSGGHFVGAVGTKQPRNTWVGYNIAASQFDGMLMALETPYTLTDTLSGDSAANSTRALYYQRGSVLVWAGNTHAYSLAIGTGAPPLAINSVAIGSAAAPFVTLTDAGPRLFEPTNEVLYLVSGAATLLRIDLSASTAASTTIPAACSFLITWDQYVLAASGRVIYFSNPGTASTWTSTDSFSIGSNVTGWCVHQGNLFIATQNGWYVATGIPNSTLAVRQITTIDSGGDPVSIDTSVLTTSSKETQTYVGPTNLTNGPIVRELAGSRTRPFNWAQSPDGRPPTYITDGIRHGEFVIFTGTNQNNATDEGGATVDLGTTIWVFNTRTGVWYRRQIPSSEGVHSVAAGRGDTDLLIYRRSTPTDNFLFSRLNSPDLIMNPDGTWGTATAQLAEYYHPVPFRVKEILIEVDFGPTQATTAQPNLADERTVSVSVKTPGVPIERGEDLSLSRSQTSIMSHIFPSRGQETPNSSRVTTRRAWARLNPSDGSDTFTAAPVVTISGVKLRRLIMKCEEVS